MSSEPSEDRAPVRLRRMLRRGRNSLPRVTGSEREPLTDIYHQIMALPLLGVIALMGATFVAINLVFARVSRPTARVSFSSQVVIHAFDGAPTLMFRAANRRANLILEAEVMVSLARDVTTVEGLQIRRFEELKIRRPRTPLFAYSWTVMHPIDESSPLWGVDQDQLAREKAEILVILSGVDDRYAQRVHARHSYSSGEITWNKRFADILSIEPGGQRVVDYTRFHDVVEL